MAGKGHHVDFVTAASSTNLQEQYTSAAVPVKGDEAKEGDDEGLRKVKITFQKLATKSAVAKVDPSTLVADLEEVFSLGYIPLNSFVEKVKNAQKKAADQKVELKSIDFGKDGYITDTVIKTLVQTLGKSSLASVTKVSLEGCGILTDVGLHWLVDGLSQNQNNIQVNINGCTKVTDGGLAILAYAPNIGHIEAMATTVAHLKDAGNTKGCPLLVDPNRITNEIQKESFISIIPIGTKQSLSAYIKSKESQDREPFHYDKAVQISDWKINIAEVDQKHVLFEHVLTPNPVHVLLPFDMGLDVKEVKNKVIETIGHVLSKERLNPQHVTGKMKTLAGSQGFMLMTSWSKCSLSLDGILRNTSDIPIVIGAVVSEQPLSRSNSYYEVQCILSQPETGIIIGVMHDILMSDRFPLDSKERSGGAVDGHELEDGAVYGFGIKGEWESEYVPSEEATYYFTKNGVELPEKKAAEKPHIGMYPIVSVMGKSFGGIRFLNMACPPQAILEQWEENNQYWTPAFKHNVLCDDQGIISYANNYKSAGNVGILLCQEEISKMHNTFSIKILSLNSGIVSIGLGPEDYALNRQPGWDSGSIGFHGDNGKVYVETGTGKTPSSGKCYLWKTGDEIKAVVSSMGEGDTIQDGNDIHINFFVNNELMAAVKTNISGSKKGVRTVFMVGVRGDGVKVEMKNYRPPYLPRPPRMDMLTMGSSRFMNVYDDGRLIHRQFDKREQFSLFVSKTPFNKNLTHFELTVKRLGQHRHASIGFVPRGYPINNMAGWLQGSAAYHADNGQLYLNSSSGIKTLVDDDQAAYSVGDLVGCGLDANKAKFREDGSLENQQTLQFYFTKNGKKVHEFEFKYESDGIYPAANLHYGLNELLLHNYYPGAETGDLVIIQKRKEESSKQQDNFVEGCRFTVVGVGAEGSDPKGKLQIVQQLLGEGLEFPMMEVIEKHIMEMERNPNMMDLQGQQLYAQLCWQKECLERFLKNKSRLKFMTVNLSSEQGHKELVDHIVEVCENDLQYHSSFYNQHESVTKGLQKITDALTKEKLMASTDMLDLVGKELGQNRRTFEAAVRYLQAKGRLIWIPMKRTVIAIDMAFAETLAGLSLTVSNTLSGKKAPCIGEETRIWNCISDILPQLKSLVQSQSPLLSHTLTFFGVMKIPCLRVTKEDPQYCYCTRNALGKLPVQLSDFVKPEIKDVVLVQREYHFLYSSPITILSMLISRCFMFSRAVAISHNWGVFQNGAAQTVIYIQGERSLRIETRCYMPSEKTERIDSDTQFHVEEYAFNIFCIFTDLIDLIINRLKIKITLTQKAPRNFVNTSIGCIHNWGLSDEDFRQTLCTLCGQCCEKGSACPYNGVEGEYQHQCGCNTLVTGCKDCGICENCADLLWTIRSYLRPNLEVAGYEQMKTNPFIPLNATTYDEVEFTNLGTQQTPVCLKVSTGQYASTSDNTGTLTKMFPAIATEFPNSQSLAEHMTALSKSKHSDLHRFNQGDIVTIKLDPIKRDPKMVLDIEEESPLEVTPVYFTSICREATVWHDTGIVAYTSLSPAVPVGQFIGASPLTPECPSFSFEIINPGENCYIAIGICHKRYPPDRQPGWNAGSIGYHADDGGVFMGSGWPAVKKEKCVKGDVMKLELNFEKLCCIFYKNGKQVYTTQRQRSLGISHPAIGFHSVGEAVLLLEKEPWKLTGDEEPVLPSAFESYKYGNMNISPGRTLALSKIRDEALCWLMIHNPSKTIVGYKIFPASIVSEPVGFLSPSKSETFMLAIKPSQINEIRHVDIHWFLLESNRDYSDVDIGKLYDATTSHSLLKHRLKVKVTDVQSSDSRPLKLASEEPDANDSYQVEVFKNGVSVQKYWLKTGDYVCCLPQKCNVLVRYPKFPTLDQPNAFQKGMRVIVDLTKTEKDLYAEALVEDATPGGDLRLEYSQPGETGNSCMEVKITSPEISIREIEYETVEKAVPSKKDRKSGGEGNQAPDTDTETEEKVAAINLISFHPRGHVAVTKRAYMFPPFHLLTEASQAAITSIDSAWKANTLNSVAQCKNVPTRLTVQELQLSQLVGTNLDWLMGANPQRRFDLAFAFLPSNLGHNELCYPTIPSIFEVVDVHRLCFLVDQMYYNIRLAKDYELSLDVPMHFVNVPPIAPSPPLSAETMFASSFNGWTYSTLYSNKLLMPLCDKVFPGGRPNFERKQVEHLMKSMLHVYAAQCHIFAEQYGGIMLQATPEDGTSTVTDSIQHKDHEILRKTDKMELNSDVLIKKAFRNNVFCKAHQWCLPTTNVIMEDEFEIKAELFSPYEETVNVLFREMPTITALPPNFYNLFPNLQYLKLQSCEKLKELPEGISKCLRLEMVSLKNNALEVLPADLFRIPYLTRLHCSGLQVKALPTSIMDHCIITELILSNMLLNSIPKELGRLTSLEYLNLNSNPLETLPMELAGLTKLRTLLLSGIPWLITAGSKVEMPLDQFEDFLKTNVSLRYYLGKEKLISLFHEYDHNKNARLDDTETAALNTYLFWNVPRIGGSCINCTEFGGIPPVIFLLSGLETLHLDYQAITAVPVHMCRLQNLKVLSISNNPLLESLPGSLGHLPSLKSLRLVSNPSLRTPPHEVVSRGFASIKAYLKKLAGGFIECRRTKLMLVGLGGAGKTSLLRALMSPSKKTEGTKGKDITNGIDILPWTLKTSDGVEVTYNTWDFAGQTLYYNTHQFFLSKRAVYLLLWSTRQGFEHAGLEFWLSSIASHAPKTPIFVVGTHCDQVPKADIPVADFKERYPQIAGFHFVSSVEGIGIVDLEKELLKVTLEQKNMGEKVPKVWLSLEKKILKARSDTSILPWKVIQAFGMEVGIYDQKDIREAIQFLHELGTVQYFDNEFLREQVVINPQWIVNVMSCVVSVKNSPIQEHKGRFHHKYIPSIWSKYPENLHKWLLQLTEEFDLTFPLPEDNVNIVPCLLPQEAPSELNWPVADINKNLKETKLIYKFTYLPAGLFNRAQVRLFQLSDGKLIWKRGSLLKKNKHQALISQTTDSELQVKVQGPRPENVIFLIHEIFESLIQESFHGVVYEFLVPCPDCIQKEGTLDPSMFEGSLVRRAREHRAPFLQCRKYFHTISMAQLFEVMPSDSASDFDAHLQNSLTVMQQLNSDLQTDVAIIYSASDKVGDNDPTRVNPEQIKRDLEAAGLTCWYSDNMDGVSVQDVMLALKNCKVVVALVSNNFERDDKSHDLLLYTMDTLGKDSTIVVIGEGLEWQNTDLGMRIGKQEILVMVRNKSRYEARIKDMIASVRTKLLENQQKVQQHPSVFISYAWKNSSHAKSMGTPCPPGAIGWGDPREIRNQLEKKGLSCWIDHDQPSSGHGLFKNITEGIRNSKVLVACVSDEYVEADNCMMELRFGVLNMNVPTVICVVGTGKKWKESEVGLLMHRSKAAKVYFQEENPEAIDILETFIRQRLPQNADALIQQEATKQAMKSLHEQEKNKEKKKTKRAGTDNASIQEEYELMQRKFMRHIISFVSNADTVPTPRLIIIDFEKHGRNPSKRDSQNESDSVDGHVRSSTIRPTLRPKTASRSSRLMNVVLEDEEDTWESEAFCLKLLCEDEKGWHVCKKSFPLRMNEDLKNTVKGCSAYLARMFAILRQSAVRLNCFSGPVGQKFTSWVEKHAVENVNFLHAYTTLRTKLVEDDTAQEFLSQLYRCHLPTGKIYWLCDKHSSGPRITRLSAEATTRSEVGRVLNEEDIKLRDNLEKSETYKKKKQAKNPAAGISLPPMLDMLGNAQSSPEDSQALIDALKAQEKAAKEVERQNADMARKREQAQQRKASTTAPITAAVSAPAASPVSTTSKASLKTVAKTASAVSKTSNKSDGSKTCSLQ